MNGYIATKWVSRINKIYNLYNALTQTEKIVVDNALETKGKDNNIFNIKLNEESKIKNTHIGGICSISTSLMPDSDLYSELINSFYTSESADVQYRSINTVASKSYENLSPEQNWLAHRPWR